MSSTGVEPPPTRPYLSIAEAATQLGVSRVSIWRWIRAGLLPARRFGHRTVRIYSRDLEHMNAQRVAAASGMRLLSPDTQEPTPSRHVVRFYDDDGALAHAVAEFIGAALDADNAGIIIATEAHRIAIEQKLQDGGRDLANDRVAGRYISLNALETLTRIMRNDAPDPAQFLDVVGSICADATRGGRQVRVFGEMGGLLAEEGIHDAVIALEGLWNQYLAQHDIELLCSYRMADLQGASLAPVMAEICDGHSRVIPTETYLALAEPVDQLRVVADLQQKARSLEFEVRLRDRLELQLRAATREARTAVERMRRLQEITEQLSRSLAADQVLQTIASSAADLLAVGVGAVFLLENGDPLRDFVLAAAHGIDALQTPNLRLPRSASLAGRALDEGQTLIVDDVRVTPGTALPALLTGETAGSEIAAPIIAGDVRLGVVKAFSPKVRRFNPDDASLLTSLAAAAAVALTNARLFREAQDAIEARDEFLSAAAHDLSTPLAAVKGTAQLLRRILARGEVPVNERVLAGLESIDATATKMGRQLEELVSLSRMEVGAHPELRCQTIDLVELVKRIAAEQQRLTERHHFTVRTAVPMLSMNADAVRLGRLLDNLVSNAIKYSPNGGDINIHLTVESGSAGMVAVLTVQDYGIGIPAADLAGVFDRFSRAANVKGRIPGTGIGLASARQIVEQHSGTISVESADGAGSTFTVRLPVCHPN